MAADGSVIIEIDGDASKFKKTLSGLGNAAGKALKGIATAVTAVSAAVGAGAAYAVKAGSEYETSLAKVGTIADTSVKSLEELSQEVLALSDATGMAAANVNEAVYQAISGGVDTAEAVGFVEKATKLAAGGFTEASTAVDVLTTTLNAYGLGADQAERVSDMLITTQNLGKTTVDELASSVGKVIPVAAAYGVEMDNLSSAYAILTANGIATAETTTYLKSMLNELGDSGSAVSGVLQEQTGKSFAQLMDEGYSLGDVIAILGDSVNNDAGAFNELWSSSEAGVGALTLLNSGAGEFNTTLEAMRNSAGATEQAYETMSNTFEHQLEVFKNSATNLAIEVYEGMKAPLTDMLGLANDYMGRLKEAFTSGGLEGLAEEFGAVLADAITEGVNHLPDLINTAVSIIQALVDGIVANKDQLIDGAIAAIEAFAGGIAQLVPTLAEAAYQLITGLVEHIIADGPEMLKAARETVTSWIDGFADHLPEIISTGVELVASLIVGLVQQLPNLVYSAGELVVALIDAILSVDWLDVGVQIIKGIAMGLIGAVGALVDAAIDAVKKVIEKVKEWLGIKSPSRRFRDEVGAQIPPGIGDGIEEQMPSLTREVEQELDGLMKKVNVAVQLESSAVRAPGNPPASGITVEDVTRAARAAQPSDGNRTDIMEVDGREFARITFPYFQEEAQRRGERFIVGVKDT